MNTRVNKKTVAIIPVRGGSKSVPLKNIKEINGRPLVFWSIDAAVQCEWINEVYVSTDSIDIRNIVLNYDRDDFGKLKCIDRNPENATDFASTESVLLEFIEKVKSEVLVLVQATSPLIRAKHLDEALHHFNTKNFDSILSVVKQKRFIWRVEQNGLATPVNYIPEQRPRRQEFNGFFVENGAFYITRTQALLKTGVRISGKIGYYEMPEETYFEIDEPQDWIIIEHLLKESSANKLFLMEKARNIKLLATDCDGVLTDAGMYYSAEGDVLKKFNTKDGMGLSMLKEKGIILAILTGEKSDIVKKRAEKLGIEDVYLDCKDKVSAMEELLLKYNLSYKEVGYIGDDVNDLGLLKKVGLSLSVNDAAMIVRQSVDYVTEKNGGQGAVREISDLILSCKV